jgi:hypothetical protein
VFGRQKCRLLAIISEAAFLLELLDRAAGVPISRRRGDGTSQERQGKKR